MGSTKTASPDGSGLQVERWKQFGQDRLYVHTTDGVRVGWLNLTNQTEVLEVPELRAEFRRALDAYLIGPVTPTPTADPPPTTDTHADPGGVEPQPAPPVAEDQPVPRLRRPAGESAQREYDRRRTNDRARARRTRPLRLTLLLASPVVGYGLARLVLLVTNRWGPELLAKALEVEVSSTSPMLDPVLVRQLSLASGALLALSALGLFLRPKQTTDAFRIGAEGERRTAAILAGLPSTWRVVHDLDMPRGRGNIDHVAIGPPGVFTIETKNYVKGIVIQHGRAMSAGRSAQKVVDQANRQAKVIAKLAGVSVHPVVAVHGGGVTVKGWRQKPVIAGVRFCSGSRLVKVLTEQPPRLSSAEVERIATAVRDV